MPDEDRIIQNVAREICERLFICHCERSVAMTKKEVMVR